MMVHGSGWEIASGQQERNLSKAMSTCTSGQLRALEMCESKSSTVFRMTWCIFETYVQPTTGHLMIKTDPLIRLVRLRQGCCFTDSQSTSGRISAIIVPAQTSVAQS